jgi:hypothetical protein
MSSDDHSPPLRPPRPFFFPQHRHSAPSTDAADDDRNDSTSDSDRPSTPPTASAAGTPVRGPSPSHNAPPNTHHPHVYHPRTPRTHHRPTASSSSLSRVPVAMSASSSSLARGPPPSSFVMPVAFPFQSYPGNPDPGTPIPGFARRRFSFDAAFTPQTNTETEPIHLRESNSVTDIRMSASNPLYRNSAAGAIVSGTVSDIGHGSGSRSLVRPRSSSQTFRSPFLSPASRPSSSLWSPPSAYPSRLLNGAGTSPVAASAASSALALALPKSKPPLPSTALPAKLTRADKPWLTDRNQYSHASWWLTFLCFFLGLAAAAVLCWRGVVTVNKLDPNQLCLLFEDQFETLDTDNSWTRDVEMSGFGSDFFLFIFE